MKKSSKKHKDVRYFIVGPTEAGKEYGDTLHEVHSTSKHCSFRDAYAFDLSKELAYFDTYIEAENFCKRKGMKRVTII